MKRYHLSRIFFLSILICRLCFEYCKLGAPSTHPIRKTLHDFYFASDLVWCNLFATLETEDSPLYGFSMVGWRNKFQYSICGCMRACCAPSGRISAKDRMLRFPFFALRFFTTRICCAVMMLLLPFCPLESYCSNL